MIDILIPTVGRSHVLGPLLGNIRATTKDGAFYVYFVLDRDDTASDDALDRLDPDVDDLDTDWQLVYADGSYPEKTNAALHWGAGDLVLPTADDVRFHSGWLDSALNALSDPSVQVVGTDDLSPVTAQRKLATMPILRRSYIKRPGAAWGERNTVFHSGYHHSFVDTELWELAIHRGVAAWADDCVIEHLHPSFGKREVDETDRKGNLSNWDEDEALFLSRREQWLSS